MALLFPTGCCRLSRSRATFRNPSYQPNECYERFLLYTQPRANVNYRLSQVAEERSP